MHRTGSSYWCSKISEGTLSIFRHTLNEELFWLDSVYSFIHSFLFSHRNKNLSQFYLRTMYFLFLSYEFSNHASSTPLTIGSEHYLHVLLNGNSFLYHQIRKMIGGAVAVSCGSWSFPYLQACIYFLCMWHSIYYAVHSGAIGSQYTISATFRFVSSR